MVNKRKTKGSKKTSKKTSKRATKKQKGGDVGTQFWNLPSDMGALAVSTVNTMIDTVKLMVLTFEIPADLGVVFGDSGAPGVNNP